MSERIDLVIKVQAERFKELMKWRSYLPVLVEAVERVLGESAEVYVFGSAVEGELTIDSDIDILVVLDEVPSRGVERAKVVDKIWRLMESKGVPWWYPFEVHLATREELEMLRRGGAKLVDVKTITNNVRQA